MERLLAAHAATDGQQSLRGPEAAPATIPEGD